MTDSVLATPSASAGPGPLQGPLQGPRESMGRLPHWLQQPLTIFTGRPLPEQTAPRHWSRTYHLVAGVMFLVAGTAVSGIGWHAGGGWLALLAPGWATTLHGLRNLRMLIFHQCSHMNMYRMRRLDAFIGEVLASLLVVQNAQRYRREHITDHHAVHHMTMRDPTVQAFLLTLDVHPGMTRSRMRRRILGKILSPVFHVRFAIARLRSFWSGSTILEKTMFLFFHGGAVLVCTLTGQATVLVVAWYVPLFPLFQVSNVLRLCVKHLFPAPGTTERRGREYFASLTSAVFVGEAAPPPGLPWAVQAWRWAGWWARMVLVHGPVRYLLITADTPVHDWHHRYPAASDWAHHLYSRQADLDSGSPGWPPYTEQWGYLTAMNNVLDSLSRADPAEYDVRRLRQARGRDLFAAFDD